MSRRYSSRIINHPDDTVHMQSLLRRRPKIFFCFPEEWQEWFMTHPEMLESPEKNISIEILREMLYAKIVQILVRDNGVFGPEVGVVVTLLLHSGLEMDEIRKKIESLIHKKTP